MKNFEYYVKALIFKQEKLTNDLQIRGFEIA